MKKTLSQKLLEKSVNAMQVAIENYNKPSALYREETFSLLALNAWELLLKAKLIEISNNKINAIYVYEAIKKKDGTKSKKLKIKKNRTKHPQTVSPAESIKRLSDKGLLVATQVVNNIDALLEIRDTSAHFINTSQSLFKLVNEIGAASVQNFIQASKDWFQKDFSKNFTILLPLGFYNSSSAPLLPTKEDQKLLDYLTKLSHQSNISSANTNYSFSLELNISFNKNKAGAVPSTNVISVAPGTPGATPIYVGPSETKKQYPWSYEDLVKDIKKKDPNILTNPKFHNVIKQIKANHKLATFISLHRTSNPNHVEPTKKGSLRYYYSNNATVEFLKLYALQ